MVAFTGRGLPRAVSHIPAHESSLLSVLRICWVKPWSTVCFALSVLPFTVRLFAVYITASFPYLFFYCWACRSNLRWNFAKFLIDRHGQTRGRYDTNVDPIVSCRTRISCRLLADFMYILPTLPVSAVGAVHPRPVGREMNPDPSWRVAFVWKNVALESFSQEGRSGWNTSLFKLFATRFFDSSYLLSRFRTREKKEVNGFCWVVSLAGG
jgi:hypothetical protein